MFKAGIYHRPESEDITLLSEDTVAIRIKTALNDIKKIKLLYGDPYLISADKPAISQFLIKKRHDDIYDYWELELEQKTKRLAYAFLLEDYDGEVTLYADQQFYHLNKQISENGSAFFKLPYFHLIDASIGPRWVKETVWYQIFPDRFNNGNINNDPVKTLPWDSTVSPQSDSFYGGDLEGIIEKLDYLIDLGINGLYLTPIFKAPSNHKYDTSDYYEVDVNFGDKATLKKLIDEAHKRNMRVMLDAVFNHIGDQSPIWQDVIKNENQSQYIDWFHINHFPIAVNSDITDEAFSKKANYDTFAFTPHMPKWNTSNPEVQEYLLSIGEYWVKEFGIDAWRLDVANEVDHHFWRQFSTRMKQIKPNIYILGEIWHTSQPWLDGSQFDGVMNYAYMQHIKDFFIQNNQTPEEFTNRLTHELMLYSETTNQMMFNLLDSHDTARIQTEVSNEKIVRQLLMFMFMQPGTPDIYYGTELGMTGGDDPDNRKPMAWQLANEDNITYQNTKIIIKIRRQYAKLFAEGNLVLIPLQDGIVVKRQLGQKIITGVFSRQSTLPIEDVSGMTVLFGNEDILERKLAPHSVFVYLTK